jgi:PAS domain S-box-containing protein
VLAADLPDGPALELIEPTGDGPDGRPAPAFVVLTPPGAVPVAVEALRAGACEVVERTEAGRRGLREIVDRIGRGTPRPARPGGEGGRRDPGESLYRALVERSGYPIALHCDGRFEYLNGPAARILGGDDPDEFRGEDVSRYFLLEAPLPTAADPPDSPPPDRDGVRRRGRLRRRDGREIEVEILATPTRHRGRPAGQMIFRDITVQALREEERDRLAGKLRQAQRLETIGTLAGGIAHDFNNIIQAILGFAEMARADLETGSRTHSDLENILQAARRAKRLVEQILTFSRLDDRKREIVDLGEVVRESLDLLRATLPRTIELRSRLPEGSLRIHADPTQVQQVLVNLGANSYQAMPDRHGTIEVALDRIPGRDRPTDSDAEDDEADGGWIRLRVRDDGPGMAPEVRDRIFEPFFTTKAIGEGTGLGLSVVHGIVSSHGGTISVRSRPGEGATFEIHWPGVDAEIRAESVRPEDPPPTGKGRILVVDDEPAIARMVKRVLERAGYEVVETTESRAALQAFGRHPDLFDALVTDQTMPEIPGTELVERVRAIRPELPVVLMTGFSETVGPEEAEALAIGEFLMKPVTSDEIARAVRRVLTP